MEEVQQLPTEKDKKLLGVFIASFDNSQGDGPLQGNLLQLAFQCGDLNPLDINENSLMYLQQHIVLRRNHVPQKQTAIDKSAAGEVKTIQKILSGESVNNLDNLLTWSFQGILLRDYLYQVNGRPNRKEILNQFSEDTYASYLQEFAVKQRPSKYNFENQIYTHAHDQIEDMASKKTKQNIGKIFN